MAFSYCPHCGFKNMYSLQAPKFCGGCGEGLNILSAAKTNSASVSSPTPTRRALKRRAPVREPIVDDPDGTDVYEVPNITNFAYSIEQDKNKFNLKDMIPLEELEAMQEDDQPKPTPKKAKRRGRPRKS
jgi:hypothetical protein